ncbi:hypothetical protein [Lewinella sp. W8]|uniref:hypothetical protein n=1 Tax=Lewinella sp. W8 TaxID=2528208 RepID=UPI00106773D7|nr:hypothetical protein [Lewinella sp. W8]MTB51231.1 hypothetical protein [Lewinella sp. W8]
MQPKFKVTLQQSKPLAEIAGDWTTSDYNEILRMTDYGDADDLDGNEFQGMALLSLSELEKDEAAQLLIEYVFPEDALSEGQAQNAAHQMEDEKLWEEYPDPTHHRNFFRVGSLLYRAFNGGFPKPDARKLTIHVNPKSDVDPSLLATPTPAFTARLLAAGMEDRTLIHRLYEDELKSEQFPAAATVVWSVKSTSNGDGSFQLDILGSDYWLEDYRPADAYECVAYPDTVAVGDEE